MSLVTQVAAGLVVASTTATAGTCLAIYRLLHKHERTLYGAEDVDGWAGLVERVEHNRQKMNEHAERIEDIEES